MREITDDWECAAAGGLTLGADPIAAAMLRAVAAAGTRLDAFVVRKADKVHGLQRRIEGREHAPAGACSRWRTAGAEVVVRGLRSDVVEGYRTWRQALATRLRVGCSW
jgi:orotate phosphoribosyltransferase